MDTPELVILIATCGRQALLERLLGTLAECRRPATLRSVIIAENGPKYDAEAVAARFADRLPIVYRYSAPPNKCRALNDALATVPDDHFVLFFDDDVRVHPDAVQAYSDAVAGRRGGVFYGGRCLVDYEEPPPAWLRRYLPASARGWAPAETMFLLKQPHALGFNWGAFNGDMRRAGYFDENGGPGTARGIGDETDLQRRLFAAGVQGYFLPTATVWHYVPRERCSESWALKRARQNGYVRGLSFSAAEPERKRARRRYRASLVRMTLLLAVTPSFARPERRFHYRYWIQRHLGMLRGLATAIRPALR